MRETAKRAVRLMLFALVAGLLLAFVNAVTEGPIARNVEEKKNASREAVIGSYEFAAVDCDLTGYGQIAGVYAATESGQTIGYVYELTGKGYGGEISLSMGIKDGQVTGVSIATHAETKGLGTAQEASFLESFVGLTSDTQAAQVDAMSGATISSQGVKSALGEALSHYAKVLCADSQKEGA